MRDFGAGFFVTAGDRRLRNARVSKQADSEHVWSWMGRICDAAGGRFSGSSSEGRCSLVDS